VNDFCTTGGFLFLEWTAAGAKPVSASVLSQEESAKVIDQADRAREKGGAELMLAFPKPKDARRCRRKLWSSIPDGREVCNFQSAAGRAEYERRKDEMWHRQNHRCILCGGKMLRVQATFEHEDGRGMKKEKQMFEYLKPAQRPVIDGLEEHEVVYAKDQPQYLPLRSLRSNNRNVDVMSRWTLTPEQRKAVADGADIFLTLMTFGNPLQPILMAVSDNPNLDYFRHTFNLPAKTEKGF
jgi:hypothetical protein